MEDISVLAWLSPQPDFPDWQTVANPDWQTVADLLVAEYPTGPPSPSMLPAQLETLPAVSASNIHVSRS